MKKEILIKTKKEINNDDLKRIFNYSKTTDDCIIVRFKIPFESELAKENIERINENLSNDDKIIDDLIESNFDDYAVVPYMVYREYLKDGLEYNTKLENGKIKRTVIVNDALIEATTDYYISINDIVMSEVEGEQFVLCPSNPLTSYGFWDYESINKYAPDIVKKLLDNGYAVIDELDLDDGCEYIND